MESCQISWDERRTVRSSRKFVQLVERALQVFKLLPSFRELAFSGQALIIGQVSGGFRDERVEIGCWLGYGGWRSPVRRLRRNCAATRCRGTHGRGRSAKKSRHCRLEGRPVRQPVLECEHHEAQLRHRTPFSLKINRFRI